MLPTVDANPEEEVTPCQYVVGGKPLRYPVVLPASKRAEASAFRERMQGEMVLDGFDGPTITAWCEFYDDAVQLKLAVR